MKRPDSRLLTAVMLAASLVACGGIQGARGGLGSERISTQSDAHLTEYDSNDTSSAALRDGGDSSGESGFGPAFVP
jgi:hypothetical protein